MREWNRRNPDKVKASRKRRDPERLKAQRKRYRERHSGAIKARQQEAVANNFAHYQAYKKEWYEQNKERCLELNRIAREKRFADDPEGERAKKAAYMRERRKDPNYLAYSRMGSLVRKYLIRKKIKKGGLKWERLVGYTLEQLEIHLRSTLPDKFTWDNYLSGELELDHIVPAMVFDVKEPGDEDFRKCWSLDNLRLLTRADNLARRNQNDYGTSPILAQSR